MKKWMKIAGIALAVAGLGVVGARFVLRAPTGATSDYGGTLQAKSIPEFTSLEAGRWVNGAPASLASARGQVVLIEAWHPA
jgi:hypothetical protein